MPGHGAGGLFGIAGEQCLDDGQVLVRLLDAFTAIATQTERAERRSLLRRHANLVLRAAEESLPEQLDRDEVARRHRALVNLLES